MTESQKRIIYSVIVLCIVLIISYYGYKKFISTPNEKIVKKDNSKDIKSKKDDTQKENKKENKKQYIAPAKPKPESDSESSSEDDDELDRLIDKVNERR